MFPHLHRCQHENLVELLGFSSDSDDLCLVYAYMPNGSLLDRLSCLVRHPSPDCLPSRVYGGLLMFTFGRDRLNHIKLTVFPFCKTMQLMC